MPYAAAALSLVLHSANPHLPTFRSDVRYFQCQVGREGERERGREGGREGWREGGREGGTEEEPGWKTAAQKRNHSTIIWPVD